MTETTTVQVHKDVYDQLNELKTHSSTSFNDVISDLVRVAEQHDSNRNSLGESDTICPKH